MDTTRGVASVDFSAFVADRTRDFTGREWVFHKVNDWLADPDVPRAFLLVGGPGTGKSAIMARLAQFSLGQASAGDNPRLAPGFLVYDHFCQAQQDATLNPARFVEALSLALAARYETFARALIEQTEGDKKHITIKSELTVTTAADGSHVQNLVIQNLNVGSISARVAFDKTVRRPLEALSQNGSQENIVILVDSLDEARTWREEENILTLLADTLDDPRDLPPQVRFVLASRPDERVLSTIGLAPSLDLIGDAPPDAQEVRRYASIRLAKAPLDADLREGLAIRVAESGEGNFLYARYVLDDWLARPAEITLESALDLPAGLSGIYLQFLKRELARDEEKWEDRYQPLLGLLAVARGEGLTVLHLVGASGLERRLVDNTLRACGQYLVRSQPEGSFRIYHQSFRNFLLNDGTYTVYPAEAHQALGAFFLGEQGNDWIGCQDRYALEYTPAHLTGAVAGITTQGSRRALGRKLSALLADFNYLEAKTWRLGVSSLLTDLQAAIGTLSGDDKVVDSLPLFLKAISSEVVSLSNWDRTQNNTFFAQQLRNRAAMLGLAKLIKEAETRLAYLNRPYLKLLWYAPFGSNVLEPSQQGRVDILRARAFTPFGRWPVRIRHEEPTESGDDMSFPVARSLEMAKMFLADSSRRSEFTDPRSESPIEGLPEIEFNQSITNVGPGGLVIGIQIDRLVLNDAGILARDWAPYITQTMVAMTADRRWAIAVLRDGRLRVLDAETGQEQAILTGHSAPVSSLAGTQNGRRLVSGSVNGSIKVWDLDANLEELSLSGHDGPITALVIAPTDDLLISASADGSLKAWDLASGHEKYTLSGHTGVIHAAAMTQDGQMAISASADHTLKVWDLMSVSEAFTLSGHDGPVLSVALAPDGRHAVSASQDSTLKIWDLASRQAEHTLNGHSDAVHTVLVTSDGSRIISAAEDDTLRVWDMETGREKGTFRVGVFATQLLLNGARLAVTGWWSNRLEVWDVATSEGPGQIAFSVMDHDLGHLARISDGETILAGDEMGAVYCLRYVEPNPGGQG